jgi:hypothetical protein
MTRQRANLTGPSYEIKEELYRCGAALLRPVMVMISDTYPAEKREERLHNGAPNPDFDSDTADEYHKAYDRARKLLHEQRNIANDKHLPRFEVRRYPGEATEASRDLESLIVDGCLDRLRENLITWSPILVDEKYVKQVQETIQRVYPNEEKRLRAFIRQFTIEYVDGALPTAMIIDTTDIQYDTRPRTSIPNTNKGL